METRRLQYLYELHRTGSMRAVADILGATTSTVSQQIAQLTREVGTTLIEPDGRGVRLTPAGRRFAEHARIILSAVDAARLDLDTGAEPSGTVRVAGFATTIRRSLMPIIDDLATHHPQVNIVVLEHEPAEALNKLAADDIDLALTYDYNLAPAQVASDVETLKLWSTEWGLGVRSAHASLLKSQSGQPDASTLFSAFAQHDWIGNSRNIADESVLRLISSMAGFEPTMRHQSDSLDLVEDLILAGLGVGLLPRDRAPRAGLSILPLANPKLELRAFARTRKGRSSWPALALILQRLRESDLVPGTDSRFPT